MSDWFDHREGEAPAGPVPGGEENQPPPVSQEAASNTAGEASDAHGWQSPPANSWNTPSSDGQAPTAQPGGGDNGGWTAPVASPPGNYTSAAGGGYQPQGGYDPYGWQSYQPAPQQPAQPPKPPRKKSGAKVAIAVLAVVCAATIVTLSVLLAMAVNDKGLPSAGSSSRPSANVSDAAGNPNAPQLDISDDDPVTGLSTRQIVSQNLDSTVSIYAYVKGNSFGFATGSENYQLAGQASGIVMTEDGYIITNWHVVVNESTGQPYDRIDVKTHDTKIYEKAEIVGVDEATDLAVIRVRGATLKKAEFGNSDDMQLGDKVVAIGNAGGLEESVTQGIISGRARDVYEDTGYAIKCLQTDAAINPGNSGGPLLNGAGQVIAVNSAKITNPQVDNFGFAIPINEAKEIIDDLTKYGFVKGRVRLWITGNTITQLNYEGFYIKTIENDSVLKGTKAEVGDIITHVDGVRVKSYEEMRMELAKHKVGDEITLTLLRLDSRTRQEYSFDVKCTLAESNG